MISNVVKKTDNSKQALSQRCWIKNSKVMKFLIFLIFICPIFINAQNMAEQDIQINCDPITGLCEIPDFAEKSEPAAPFDGETEIIYIGDPMCSWCWGISPQLNALERYGKSIGVPFRLVMGGLRPGGGDAWNDEFKDFLRHHWEEVNKRSGQPFNMDLFEKEDFNYDTEPSCRAVVTARKLSLEKTLSFYELVQHHFYVKNNDPNQAEFYQPICEKLEIDYTAFQEFFNSPAAKELTQKDFATNRQWGIRGYPSVVVRKGDQLHLIASGFASFEDLKKRLEEIR